LAQLYAAGDGVPRNLDVAKAWYAAAAAHGLSAASSKLASLRENRAAAAAPVLAKPALIPVVPVGPVVAPKLSPGEDTFVELSWVAPAQPVQASFFVQVVALDTAGAHPTFTSYLNQSMILLRLPSTPAAYAWRVYTVAVSVSDYVPSAWSYFTLR
jgi:hypothetical protein